MGMCKEGSTPTEHGGKGILQGAGLLLLIFSLCAQTENYSLKHITPFKVEDNL